MSLDDRWQSQHLSPSYALRVVLPAQPAGIPQRLPWGKPPRREGKGSQGSGPALVSELFGFYPDGF